MKPFLLAVAIVLPTLSSLQAQLKGEVRLVGAPEGSRAKSRCRSHRPACRVLAGVLELTARACRRLPRIVREALEQLHDHPRLGMIRQGVARVLRSLTSVKVN
jgi:hypothetical protein